MATFDGFEFVSINEMLLEVSPDEVPGCPSVLVLKHVRRAAVTFCRRSRWWRATLDPITVVSGVADYDFDVVPDDTRVNGVLWAKLGGVVLPPSAYEMQDNGLGLSMVTEPTATRVNGLEVRAVLEPARNFQTLEKHLFEEFGDVIAAGALHGLKMIPNKNWSDRTGAIYYAQRFENGIQRAKNIAAKDRKNVSLQTQRKVFSV